MKFKILKPSGFDVSLGAGEMHVLKTEPPIDIAVPTYNCSQWIDDFFESLLMQDVREWRVVTRDDGSSDDTVERVLYWQRKLGSRVMIIANQNQNNLGMIGNYDLVLRYCTAEFVMLGDPDDVWKPGKVRKALSAIMDARMVFGEDAPIAVCTDAEVVDDVLVTISTSFWRWSRMKPKYVDQLPRMLMESPILTSTMMINRPLLDLALPLTGAAACPDWWIALVACAFGKIIVIHETSCFYRRHGANDSTEPLASDLLHGIRRVGVLRKRVKFLMHQLAPQARAFSERFSEQATSKQIRASEVASRLPVLGPVSGRLAALRHGLLFSSLLKCIGFFLFF